MMLRLVSQGKVIKECATHELSDANRVLVQSHFRTFDERTLLGSKEMSKPFGSVENAMKRLLRRLESVQAS